MVRFSLSSLPCLVAILALPALACGGSVEDAGGGTSTDAGQDVGGGDARVDVESDSIAPDAARDTSADTPVDAGSDVTTDTRADAPLDAPIDGATDAPTKVGDASPDAGTGLTFTLTANVFEDCMPIVSADPVHITGNLTVKNDTGTTVGPITAAFGTVNKPGGAAFGTYKLKAFSIAAIPPGSAGSGGYTKETDTFSPASACSSIACGSSVVVELTLFGAGLPTGGMRVASPVVTNSCAL